MKLLSCSYTYISVKDQSYPLPLSSTAVYCLESSTEIFYGSHSHCVCSHLLSRGLVTSSHTICFQCPAIKLKGAVDIKINAPHVRSQIHEMGGGGMHTPPPHSMHHRQLHGCALSRNTCSLFWTSLLLLLFSSWECM